MHLRYLTQNTVLLHEAVELVAVRPIWPMEFSETVPLAFLEVALIDPAVWALFDSLAVLLELFPGALVLTSVEMSVHPIAASLVPDQ